ncbi:MAG TPA: SDR family oxidoreductase [Streptosporangiaceae bacterium]|nr:SDR family oxidoreductase [Streptosporangiaceae bacterium]
MSAPPIVVTGIGGAVGSEFAATLVRTLPQATVVGVFSGERSRRAFFARASADMATRVVPVLCDLSDTAATAALAHQLCSVRPAVVVHAAANVSWTASLEDARRANVGATRNTAELARAAGCQRLIFVSSAYTSTQDWEYRNSYEQSKAEAEQLLRTAYADLQPAVFACSLVVGSSVTGAISRFHGLYPLLRLLEEYQPPFLPGNRDERIDIVPVDWAARELCAMTARALSREPAADVVAAAGDRAPLLSELAEAAVAALNRVRQAQGRPLLAEVPLVPFRRWDFLRRSIAAWNVTQIKVPDAATLDRLISVYRPYLESARVRSPQGTTCPPPPWRDYLDIVVERWMADNSRRVPSRASA